MYATCTESQRGKGRAGVDRIAGRCIVLAASPVCSASRSLWLFHDCGPRRHHTRIPRLTRSASSRPTKSTVDASWRWRSHSSHLCSLSFRATMTAARFLLFLLLVVTTTLFRTTTNSNTVMVVSAMEVSTAIDITFNATSCTSCLENGEGMCLYCETQKDQSGQYRCDCEFTSLTADRNCYDAVRECGGTSSSSGTTTMGRNNSLVVRAMMALLVATTATMVTTTSTWLSF